MLRMIWFVIKLAALLGLGFWLLMQPGRSQISFMGYDIEAQTGLVVFCFILLLLSFAWLYRGWAAIKNAPRVFSRHLDDRAQNQALAAVSQGLSAIAAGDADMAAKQAERAKKLMKHDYGLVSLLMGMTARLNGDATAADSAFRALLNTKETAFIGVRGLLQLALDRKQYDQGLVLARQAHRMHPKQTWILKTLYDLELRARHWVEAQDLLSKLLKFKSFDGQHAASDKAAMLLARAIDAAGRGLSDQAYFLTREAYETAPSFLPSALAYTPFLIRRDAHREARRLIEKCWKINPHPDLKEAWIRLMPDADASKHYQWLSKLARVNPDHEDTHLMLADAALMQGLTGQARVHLDAAQGSRKSQKSVRLMAQLEEKLGNHHAADVCRDAVFSAAPDRAWVCRETGRIYAAWMPFAPPHNSFNTIIWHDPATIHRSLPILSAQPDMGDALQLIEYKTIGV
jgi:HemY protein